MFQAYVSQPEDSALQRLAWSTLAALLTFGCLTLGIMWWARRPVDVKAPEKEVDVRFRPPPTKVETPPPPPPAPRVETKKPVAARAAPKALVAPTEMPKTPPPEVEAKDAVAEKFTAVGGTGDGSAPSSDVGQAPINLPENAVPPKEAPDNAPPEFPESARRTGAEGQVVLKVVVLADGSVGPVVVLKGEEPFVSAALSAVASWRYAPALVEGVPTAVYRIVKIPFRLK